MVAAELGAVGNEDAADDAAEVMVAAAEQAVVTTAAAAPEMVSAFMSTLPLTRRS